MSDYNAPPMWDKEGNLTKDHLKLGWLREAIGEGENFLKCQRAYPDIDRAVDMLFGPHEERIPSSLSRVYVNRLKRLIREQVATLSNLMPTWGYNSDNRAVEGQVVVLTKLLKAWYTSSFADRSIREALQYAAVEGTGYISPIWEPDFWCPGRGEAVLKTYGAKDVLPIQMPRDHDLQRCYAVIVRTEYPLSLARGAYPDFADQIQPDRTQPGWLRRGVQKVQKFHWMLQNIQILTLNQKSLV